MNNPILKRPHQGLEIIKRRQIYSNEPCTNLFEIDNQFVANPLIYTYQLYYQHIQLHYFEDAVLPSVEYEVDVLQNSSDQVAHWQLT